MPNERDKLSTCYKQVDVAQRWKMAFGSFKGLLYVADVDVFGVHRFLQLELGVHVGGSGGGLPDAKGAKEDKIEIKNLEINNLFLRKIIKILFSILSRPSRNLSALRVW